MPPVELRKDPITRSWVLTGESRVAQSKSGECLFCANGNSEHSPLQVVGSMPPAESSMPHANGNAWGARALVHPQPIYRVEGDPGRRGAGIYDRMATVGAHEVLAENPEHERPLWKADSAEIAQFLRLAAQRIQDLKRDHRFKYVTIYKNHGATAGQEFEHPTSELTATTFIPRRVLYELRAARDYFAQKERCVFCDIIVQEEQQQLRVVEVRGDYIALCPYAPRVPYEIWIMPRSHDASFEHTVLTHHSDLNGLAALLRRTLARVLAVSEAFHLVLHTSPNTARGAQFQQWQTIDEDYHWHIEIMPVVAGRSKSYTFKEVYYSDVTSESAAARLRDVRL